MAIHYVGMAGIHGCMPATCDVYDSPESAADSLAFLHNFGKHKRRELCQDRYLALNMKRYGNEYVEIMECDCATPEVHSDSA